MSVSVKGSVALLAGVLHTLLVLSHALPREIGSVSGSPPTLSKSLTQSGWITIAPPTTSTFGCTRPRCRKLTHTRQKEIHGAQHATAGYGGIRGRHVPCRARPSPLARCRPKYRAGAGTLYATGLDVDGVVPQATVSLPPAATTTVPPSPLPQTPLPTPLSPSPAAGVISKPNRKSRTVSEGSGSASPVAAAVRSGISRNGALLGTRAVDYDTSTLSKVVAATAKSVVGATATATPRNTTAEISGATPAEINKEIKSIVVDGVDVADEVMDEGEEICRRLGDGVFVRETEVAGGQRVHLRVATLNDYLDIADVRFSVFSPVHMTLKHRFRERSCALMRERRRRGAFCLVAVSEGAEEDGDRGGETGNQGAVGVKKQKEEEEEEQQQVLGTLECSKHEFDDTPLAVARGDVSRLYLTEVAVRSDCRRLGVGRRLLGLVDDVARQLGTSEIFLHVKEVNEAAVNLYTRCGYEDAPNVRENRAFTNSLGLADGFIGQRHRLMRKKFDAGTREDGDVALP